MPRPTATLIPSGSARDLDEIEIEHVRMLDAG